MNKFQEDNKITVMDGTDIAIAIQDAIAMSKSQGRPIRFDFNGQEIVVNQDSSFESVYENWAAKWKESGDPIRVKMPDEKTKTM